MQHKQTLSPGDRTGALRKRPGDTLPSRACLSRANQRLRALVQNSSEVVALLDVHGKFISKSASDFRVPGYDHANIVGKSFFDFVHDDDINEVAAHLGAIVHSPYSVPSSIELRWRDTSGQWHWLEASFTNRLNDPNVSAIVLNAKDISDRKTIAREVEHLREVDRCRGERDPLTDLYNHRTFHRLFDETIRRAESLGQPIALILIDMDNFTYVNDVHGHVVGDELLKIVAEELRHHTGFVKCGVLPEDLIVSRYGGDEFAVLLPDVDVEAAIALPTSLEVRFHSLGFSAEGDETVIPLSCSIGAAVYPHDGLTRMQVLAAATERLKKSCNYQPDNDHADRVRGRMRNSIDGFTILDALLTAVDNKDRYTRRHSEDVMVYSCQIAEELGLDENTIESLEIAALLHDVGKIGVPDQILRKPGKLTDSEYTAIKQHPTLGAIMVGAVPGFEHTLDAVLYHHERWDGKGYPSNKAGQEIPFLARIVAAADAFSAMTTDRPYRNGMKEEKALAIIASGSGTQWDPACVAALIAARRRQACETRTSPSEDRANEAARTASNISPNPPS